LVFFLSLSFSQHLVAAMEKNSCVSVNCACFVLKCELILLAHLHGVHYFYLYVPRWHNLSCLSFLGGARNNWTTKYNNEAFLSSFFKKQGLALYSRLTLNLICTLDWHWTCYVPQTDLELAM
jgi:hypothetical protein